MCFRSIQVEITIQKHWNGQRSEEQLGLGLRMWEFLTRTYFCLHAVDTIAQGKWREGEEK